MTVNIRNSRTVNCGWGNEYVSDPRSYEQYLSRNENKAWKKNAGTVLYQLS